MQRFLGAALFFKSFIFNYSEKSAKLYGMLRDGFDWDQSKWSDNYLQVFQELKDELQKAMEIHFPDYLLDWTLRVDASDTAVAACLMQKHVDPTTNVVQMQPISFTSQKLSDQAKRWDTFKKEGYSAYFGIKSNDYYLRGKSFVLETDHRNLLWIEKSLVPIVVRWRVFMQSFNFMLRHISGKQNAVADWLSRMFSLESEECDMVLANQESLESQKASEIHPPEYYLEQLHGGRNLHRGIRATWLALNKYFPGHNIPFRLVAEFIMNCPRCQKDRHGMTNNIKPLTLHLKPPHQRARIGVDRLTITPADEDGNCNLIVIVEFYKSLSMLILIKVILLMT